MASLLSICICSEAQKVFVTYLCFEKRLSFMFLHLAVFSQRWQQVKAFYVSILKRSVQGSSYDVSLCMSVFLRKHLRK